MKLKWFLLVIVSLFLLIETIETNSLQKELSEDTDVVQIPENGPVLPRSKRFIFSVDTMLTKMTNVMSFFGMDTSGMFQLQKLYNSSFTQEHLLFKRRVLNLILRTCKFIMTYLPEEPVQENPVLNSLTTDYRLYYQTQNQLNQPVSEGPEVPEQDSEDTINEVSSTDRPEIVTQKTLTTQSEFDLGEATTLTTLSDSDVSETTELDLKESENNLIQEQVDDVQTVTDETVDIKEKADQDSLNRLKRNLHLNLNWLKPFYFRPLTTRKPVYVQKNFRFGLNLNSQVNHRGYNLRRRRSLSQDQIENIQAVVDEAVAEALEMKKEADQESLKRMKRNLHLNLNWLKPFYVRPLTTRRPVYVQKNFRFGLNLNSQVDHRGYNLRKRRSLKQEQVENIPTDVDDAMEKALKKKNEADQESSNRMKRNLHLNLNWLKPFYVRPLTTRRPVYVQKNFRFGLNLNSQVNHRGYNLRRRRSLNQEQENIQTGVDDAMEESLKMKKEADQESLNRMKRTLHLNVNWQSPFYVRSSTSTTTRKPVYVQKNIRFGLNWNRQDDNQDAVFLRKRRNSEGETNSNEPEMTTTEMFTEHNSEITTEDLTKTEIFETELPGSTTELNLELTTTTENEEEMKKMEKTTSNYSESSSMVTKVPEDGITTLKEVTTEESITEIPNITTDTPNSDDTSTSHLDITKNDVNLVMTTLGNSESENMVTNIPEIDVTSLNEVTTGILHLQNLEITTISLENKEKTENSDSHLTSLNEVTTGILHSENLEMTTISLENKETTENSDSHITSLKEVTTGKPDTTEVPEITTMTKKSDEIIIQSAVTEGSTEMSEITTKMPEIVSEIENPEIEAVDSEYVNFSDVDSGTNNQNLILEIDTKTSITEETYTEMNTESVITKETTEISSNLQENDVDEDVVENTENPNSELVTTENEISEVTEPITETYNTPTELIEDLVTTSESEETTTNYPEMTTELTEAPTEVFNQNSEQSNVTPIIRPNQEDNSEKMLVQMGKEYFPAEIILTHTIKPNLGNDNLDKSEEDREEDPAHQLLYLVDNDESGEAAQEIVDRHMSEVLKNKSQIKTTMSDLSTTESVLATTLLSQETDEVNSEDLDFQELVDRLQNLEVLVNVMSDIVEDQFGRSDVTTERVTTEEITSELPDMTTESSEMLTNHPDEEHSELTETSEGYSKETEGTTKEFKLTTYLSEGTTDYPVGTTQSSDMQTETTESSSEESDLTTGYFETTSEPTTTETSDQTTTGHPPQKTVTYQMYVTPSSPTTTTDGPVSLVYPEGYTNEEVDQLTKSLIEHKNLRTLSNDQHINHLILKLAKDVNIVEFGEIMDNIEKRLEKHDKKLMVLVRKKKMDYYYHPEINHDHNTDDELIQDQLERLFHQIRFDPVDLRPIRQVSTKSSEEKVQEEPHKEMSEEGPGVEGREKEDGNMPEEMKLFVSDPLPSTRRPPMPRNPRVNDRKTEFPPEKNEMSMVKHEDVVNGLDLHHQKETSMMVQKMHGLRKKMRRRHNSTHVPHKMTNQQKMVDLGSPTDKLTMVTETITTETPKMEIKTSPIPEILHIIDMVNEMSTVSTETTTDKLNISEKHSEKPDIHMIDMVNQLSTVSTETTTGKPKVSENHSEKPDVHMTDMVNQMSTIAIETSTKKPKMTENHSEKPDHINMVNKMSTVSTVTTTDKPTTPENLSEKPVIQEHTTKPVKTSSLNHHQQHGNHNEHIKPSQKPVNQKMQNNHKHKKSEEDEDDEYYYDLDDIADYFNSDDSDEDESEELKKTSPPQKNKPHRNKRFLFDRFRGPLTNFYKVTNGEHFQNYEPQYSVYWAPQEYERYEYLPERQEHYHQGYFNQKVNQNENNGGYQVFSAPYPPAIPVGQYQKYVRPKNEDYIHSEKVNSDENNQNTDRYKEIIQAVQDNLQYQLHNLKMPTDFLGNLQKHQEITKAVESHLQMYLQNLKESSVFTSGFGPNLAHIEITKVVQDNLQDKLDSLKKPSEFLQNSQTDKIPQNYEITTVVQNNLEGKLQNLQKPSDFSSGFGPNFGHIEITKVVQDNLQDKLDSLKKPSEFLQNSQTDKIPQNYEITTVVQNNLEDKLQNLQKPSDFTSGFGPNFGHIEITEAVQADLQEKLDSLKKPSEFLQNSQTDKIPQNYKITTVVQNNLEDKLQNLQKPSDFTTGFGPNLAHAEITKVIETNLYNQVQNLKNPSEFTENSSDNFNPVRITETETSTTTVNPTLTTETSSEDVLIDIRKTEEDLSTSEPNIVKPSQISKEDLHKLLGEIEFNVLPLFENMQSFKSQKTEVSKVIEEALRKKFSTLQNPVGTEPTLNQVTNLNSESAINQQNLANAQNKDVIYSYTNPEQGLSVSSAYQIPGKSPQTVSDNLSEKNQGQSPQETDVDKSINSPQENDRNQFLNIPQTNQESTVENFSEKNTEYKIEKSKDLEDEDVRILIRDEVISTDLEMLKAPTEFSPVTQTHNYKASEVSDVPVKVVEFETLSINQDESKKAQNLQSHQEITKVVEGDLQNEIQKLKPSSDFSAIFGTSVVHSEIAKPIEDNLGNQLDDLNRLSSGKNTIQNSEISLNNGKQTEPEVKTEIPPQTTTVPELVKPQKLSLLDSKKEAQKVPFLSSVYDPNAPKDTTSGKDKSGLYVSTVFMQLKNNSTSGTIQPVVPQTTTTTTTTLSPILAKKIQDIEDSIKQAVDIFPQNSVPNVDLASRFAEEDPVVPPLLHFSEDSVQKSAQNVQKFSQAPVQGAPHRFTTARDDADDSDVLIFSRFGENDDVSVKSSETETTNKILSGEVGKGSPQENDVVKSVIVPQETEKINSEVSSDLPSEKPVDDSITLTTMAPPTTTLAPPTTTLAPPTTTLAPPTTTLAPPTTSTETSFVTSTSMVTERFKHFRAIKPKNNIVVNYIYKNLPKHAHPKGFFHETEANTKLIKLTNPTKAPGPRRGDIRQSEEESDEDLPQEGGVTSEGEEQEQKVIAQLIKAQQDLQNQLEGDTVTQTHKNEKMTKILKNVGLDMNSLNKEVKSELSNIFGVAEHDSDQDAILAAFDMSNFGQKITEKA